MRPVVVRRACSSRISIMFFSTKNIFPVIIFASVSRHAIARARLAGEQLANSTPARVAADIRIIEPVVSMRGQIRLQNLADCFGVRVAVFEIIKTRLTDSNRSRAVVADRAFLFLRCHYSTSMIDLLYALIYCNCRATTNMAFLSKFRHIKT